MHSGKHPNSYMQVRSVLSSSLTDEKQSVLVLRGRWGTGKTHIWNELRASPQNKDELIGKAIYISLFGLKTIDDLKWSILRSAYTSDKKSIAKIIRTASDLGGRLISRVIGGTPTFNSALLWLPELLKGRLVVIDDVERKHANFEIDELLGFLEEFTELHSTRFLLLMNDNELKDRSTWQTLREKVVDIEIVLNPTPTDAVIIASKGSQLPQLDRIDFTCNALGITNIRIIRKAIEVVRVLSEVVGDDVAWNPWVESAVLLTATHFRGIQDPPTIEYIRNLNKARPYLRDSNNPLSDKEARWGRMLSDLGIHSADKFEEIVLDYLETGLLDINALKELFESYRSSATAKESYNKVQNYFQSLHWDAFATNKDLCAKAELLLDDVGRLGPEITTALATSVADLGNAELSQKIVDCWIQVADMDAADPLGNAPYMVEDPEKLHPQIASTIEKISRNRFPPKSLREAVARIALRDSWGEDENRALVEATSETYRAALEEITGDELRRFIQLHAQFIRGEQTIPAIRLATMHFLEACRSIVESPPSSRLAEIIRWSFKELGIPEYLDPPEESPK